MWDSINKIPNSYCNDFGGEKFISFHFLQMLYHCKKKTFPIINHSTPFSQCVGCIFLIRFCLHYLLNLVTRYADDWFFYFFFIRFIFKVSFAHFVWCGMFTFQARTCCLSALFSLPFR